jgi:hypothetical protein
LTPTLPQSTTGVKVKGIILRILAGVFFLLVSMSFLGTFAGVRHPVFPSIGHLVILGGVAGALVLPALFKREYSGTWLFLCALAGGMTLPLLIFGIPTNSDALQHRLGEMLGRALPCGLGLASLRFALVGSRFPQATV